MDFSELAKKEEFLVSVKCFTYNQKSYIRDALDGFCMQETTFPFVCTIVDDGSTDGEQDVIKEYLRAHFTPDESAAKQAETDDYVLFFAQHKSNSNCYFAVFFLKYNHYSIKKTKAPYLKPWQEKSKYIAWCEGDDFWTDSMKLQTQVEYMESHPDCSLCFHAHRNLYLDGREEEKYRSSVALEECPVKDMIMVGGAFMASASMLYLKKATDDYPQWPRRSGIGDGPLMLVLAERGKVAYLNKVMSCYRVSAKGSWTERKKNNKKLRKEHFKRGIAMWNDYDAWSGYKHHKYVVLKKCKNTLSYYMKELRSRIKL